MKNILEKIKGGLIVSCQALENEPLHSSMIMSRMAYAAVLGGAVGIRANSHEDIIEIKKTVNLPVIGIVKREYEDSPIYITPTMKEIDELVSAKADIIALDATDRLRPNGISLEKFVKSIRQKYDDLILMADISTFEEGVKAYKLGFDILSTTLSGYTPYSLQGDSVDFELIKRLSKAIPIPVLAEGKIWVREEVVRAIELGAYAVVVGSAITRPMEITKRFVEALQASKNKF